MKTQHIFNLCGVSLHATSAREKYALHKELILPSKLASQPIVAIYELLLSTKILLEWQKPKLIPTIPYSRAWSALSRLY